MILLTHCYSHDMKDEVAWFQGWCCGEEWEPVAQKGAGGGGEGCGVTLILGVLSPQA